MHYRGPLDWAFSYRQLHVAHWLLENGADVHHAGTRGWTPIFSLFGSEACHQEPIEDYLQLLEEYSFDNWNAKDTSGWTVMHRAAAHGTGEQVESLLSRKVSLTTRVSNLGLTPVFHAVQFNNLSTLKVLMKAHPEFITATDVRDWTLLHLAVHLEVLEIFCFLLDLGADPHATSLPQDKDVPDDLRNIALTSADIARFRGSDILTAYLSALRAKHPDVQALHDEAEDLIEVFWPVPGEAMEESIISR